MDKIFESIEEWMRNLLTGMVSSNLTNMFTDVNEKPVTSLVRLGKRPRLEWQYFQLDPKSVGFCDRTDCRNDHNLCVVL